MLPVRFTGGSQVRDVTMNKERNETIMKARVRPSPVQFQTTIPYNLLDSTPFHSNPNS